MESRAAVFSREPQAVEVYQAGTWWTGELLGWRHLSDGSCQVKVRVVLAGVEETAWTELAALRLPERHLTVASEAFSAPSPQAMARVPSARRALESQTDVAATASLPLVRDLSVVGGAPRPGGRRRAPETGELSAVSSVAVVRPGGRRRAPETDEMPAVEPVAVVGSGGRRRAPETGEMPAVAVARPSGRRRAPETGELPAATTAMPAAAGRHRDADTGLIPSVRGASPVVPAVPRGAWSGLGDAEPDLLTRPMRLSDQIPHARRPRLDGSLAGV